MAKLTALTDQQYLRFGRQLLLPEWGEAGQLRLANQQVAIVGVGGLGCPALQYLAGAGVGRITLIDGDTVSLSNLPRQILYRPEQVGQAKVLAAKAWVNGHNSDIQVTAVAEQLSQDNIELLLAGVDVVLDCSDNFACRYLLNRFCKGRKLPLISAAAVGWSGQLLPILADGPCFACIDGERGSEAQSCREAGVVGPVLGTVASMQVLMALRLLLGLEVPTLLHRFDGRSLRWHGFGLAPAAACPVCGQ
ncbi:HesA/MoeB/ThiF family protein [Ferrimonas senticii]|uniref:HesA/MoeB/ThiF family protein n=1 Tax=Ferrimonas senticii TaxID=394566 RepID=UPI000412C1EB|nr:HesA/MoeB/ThiF family protein [Ferrimonas senticii]